MTEAEKILSCYMEEAEKLLLDSKGYVTVGNQMALRDMLLQARKAMDKKGQVPHTRKREFYKPREEEEVLFATERYTMAPTYIKKGVYDTYGLKPAIQWFKTRDIRYGISLEDTMENRKVETLRKCQETLSEIEYGDLPGQYNIFLAEKLKVRMSELRGKKEDELGRAIIACQNALRELRLSKVYESDRQKDFNIFISDTELEKLREDIKTDSITKTQYEEISKIANSTTLKQRKAAYDQYYQEDNYDVLNDNYLYYQDKSQPLNSKNNMLWSSTGSQATFLAPENTVAATLTITLSSFDNEKDGLGHVWVDNLEILSAQGPSVSIKNPGFENVRENKCIDGYIPLPNYWRPLVIKGAPVLKIEEVKPYCGTQDRSIYLCNPTIEDEGGWEYEEKISLIGGDRYTLSFDCKADGKLKEGLKAIIGFEDEMGNSLGTYIYQFNRKAFIPMMYLNLSMQCNAIAYAMTEKKIYAKKAKYEILTMLDDFCQGVEHWLVLNSRPEGSDAYGAVQGGRNLCSIAFTYACIKKAKVFNESELRKFYSYIDYMLRYMLDYRDRTELTYQEVQKNCGNWQTDMCIGASMILMVLADYPDRKVWLNNAYAVLKGQLLCNINPDGSWPESIRYHHAALERFSSYAKVLLRDSGENWFITTRLSEMFSYSIKTQTPTYEYFDGKIGTPPFGDHILNGGNEFSVFGIYIPIMKETNKNLADLMYETWLRGGSPIKKLWGESLAIENLQYVDEKYKQDVDAKLKLDSCAELVNAGIYIFRKNFKTKKESYFAIMSSPSPIAHGHLDQGSFQIYKNCVPIIMDSGIEGYFDVSTTWHICSYSHACMQFATKQKHIERAKAGFINLTAGTFSLERGWVDVPRTSKVIECKLGKSVDHISIEIENPESSGRHIRSVYYYKQWDVYVIKDTVENYTGKLLMSLPVVSKHSVIEKNTVYSTGYYGVNLQTTLLSAYESISMDKGRTSPLYPTDDKIPMLEYIRAVADAKNGFLTVLYPHTKEDAALTVHQMEHSWEIYIGNDKIIDYLP